MKQLRIIPFTNSLLEYLDEYYFEKHCPNQSFIGHLIDTNRLLGIDVLQVSPKVALATLKSLIQTTSEEMKTIILILSTMMSEDKEKS